MIAKLTSNMAWLLLVTAGLLEIVWATSMKASQGFTRLHFTSITFVAATLSFWLLGLAMRQLPVGTAYAVWTGIGAVGAAVLGIAFFGESASAIRIGCIVDLHPTDLTTCCASSMPRKASATDDHDPT